MSIIKLNREPRLESKHRSFEYQYRAFEGIRDLEYAAVFHEQGLGKTKIAIDLALYWIEKKMVDTVLIVAKKSLLTNWLRELSFHTYIRPMVLTQDRKTNFFKFNSPARIILTHYEVVHCEEKRFNLFLKTRAVGVIIDESAKIKNPDASVTKSFLNLSELFKKRIIMTGTPVANRPYDLWSQIWFLDQGRSLGNDFKDFRGLDLTSKLVNDKSAQLEFEQHLESLFQKISSFSVRETKESGCISLPDKITKTVYADWEPIQFELYSQIQKDLRAVVVREGLPTEDKAEVVLKRLLRLVQIASNPQLIDESYAAEPGKWPLLSDLIQEVIDRGEKCIVWSSFTDNADWLTRELSHFKAAKVHGKMGMYDRDRSLERFLNQGDCRVLVATPGAAKEGLTLTVANHVFFYDRSFSLDDYLQAQDRIHRISQTKICYVTNIVMKDSIDEWVDVLLRAKHLAAQLAQGDISVEYYKSQMSYDFGSMIKDILEIK